MAKDKSMTKDSIKVGDGIAHGTSTLNFQQSYEMVLTNGKLKSIAKY